ncbi:MAG: heme exporter protein CcmD [Gammaproteobacteria bacterium]|nr:heme exporter protein CcmD [Gammaproteobacteria bacterium]MCZ6827792.1 heme exporter protein CcmD [Gammaproteobacteria bacterium]
MLSDFLHMGGYAGYVWGSFGLTAAVLLINLVGAKRQFKQRLAFVRRRMAAEDKT